MATVAPLAFTLSPTDETDHGDLDVCKSPSSPPHTQLSESNNVACRADHFNRSSMITLHPRKRSAAAASPRRPDLEVSTKYRLLDDDCAPVNLTSSACDVISVIPGHDDSSRKEVTKAGEIQPPRDVHEKSSGTLNNTVKAGGDINRFGRRFVSGRPLPRRIRTDIVRLASLGFRLTAISRRLAVSHACVSKILNRFRQTGSLDPPPYGGRKPLVSTDYMISRIKEIRRHSPGIFAWEIRKRLVDDKSFRAEQVPSISTINRIIRHSDTVDQHADSAASFNTQRSVDNERGASFQSQGTAAAVSRIRPIYRFTGSELARSRQERPRRPFHAADLQHSGSHADDHTTRKNYIHLEHQHYQSSAWKSNRVMMQPVNGRQSMTGRECPALRPDGDILWSRISDGNVFSQNRCCAGLTSSSDRLTSSGDMECSDIGDHRFINTLEARLLTPLLEQLGDHGALTSDSDDWMPLNLSLPRKFPDAAVPRNSLVRHMESSLCKATDETPTAGRQKLIVGEKIFDIVPIGCGLWLLDGIGK